MVISDDSATSNDSLTLLIPVSCALFLSSDVQKIDSKLTFTNVEPEHVCVRGRN